MDVFIDVGVKAPRLGMFYRCRRNGVGIIRELPPGCAGTQLINVFTHVAGIVLE